MPAGMFTLIFLLRLTAPLPRQAGQGLWIILPEPPHLGQGPLLCTMPKGVRFVVRTLPVPWQSGQVSAVVPGAQPVPLQSGHSSTRPTVMSFLQPKAASSKLSVTPTRTLSPRMGPFRRAPEPDPKPKMSPRSPNISPKPPKPPNPPKSPKPAPPSPKPALGSKAAKPNWSYFFLFSGSLRTWPPR